MAELTRQGQQKINRFLEEQVAPDIQRFWRGNLLDSQQSLAQDINIYSDSQVVQVGSKNPILKYLEWGTEPHVITPDEAEALRWTTDGGEAVFATRVEHPGTKPYGHMRAAVDRERVELT